MASTGSTEIQIIKPRQKISYFIPLKIIFNLFKHIKTNVFQKDNQEVIKDNLSE